MAHPMIPAFAAPDRRHTDETARTCVVETDASAIPDGCVGSAGMPIPAEIGAERFEPVTAQLLGALGWPHGGFDPWGRAQVDSVPPSSHTALS